MIAEERIGPLGGCFRSLVISYTVDLLLAHVRLSFACSFSRKELFLFACSKAVIRPGELSSGPPSVSFDRSTSPSASAPSSRHTSLAASAAALKYFCSSAKFAAFLVQLVFVFLFVEWLVVGRFAAVVVLGG